MNSLRTLIGILLILAGSTPVFAQQTVNTELPAAAAMSDSMANPTTPATGAFQAAWDGSVWKRMTFGSAGTASSQVWTIQGIASMTPVLVTLSGTNTVQPGNTANTTPWLFSISQGGNTAAVTASSTLKVTNYNSSGTELTQDTQAQHDTAMGTVTSVTGGFLFGRASAAAPTDVSADGDAVLPWHLRNGSAVTNIAAGGTLVTATSTSLNVNCTGGCSGGTQYTHDAALTVASTVGTMAAGRASSTAPSAVSANDDAVLPWFGRNGQQVGALSDISGNLVGVTSNRLDVNATQTSAWEVTTIAGVAGGATSHYTTSAASTNATNVKASAGQVYDINVINTTATLYYLRLYNLASAPTCSSATGFVETIPIPASTSGAGVSRSFSVGRAYSTGIGFCLTGGGSSTDNTSAATGVYISIGYK